MAISIKEDFPHRRTPGMVMIFLRLMGNRMSRSMMSNGISFCLRAINDFMTSFFMVYFLYFRTKVWIIFLKKRKCRRFFSSFVFMGKWNKG